MSAMRLSLLAVVFLACAPPPTPTPPAKVEIVTIAGLNTANTGFADGPATSTARFNSPEGLALDAKRGHLYIADTGNQVLRRLDLATNEVTTVAGVPMTRGANDTADGGVSTLNSPRALVLEPGGDSLLFTDTGNLVIRRLHLVTLEVTTVLGRVGTPGFIDGTVDVATFGRGGFFGAWPGALTFDPSTSEPTLYIADSANQLIREARFTASGPVVRTLAGQGGVAGSADGPALSATFNKPAGLVIEGRRLFITEANNLTVRVLDLDAQTVSTFAGKAPPMTTLFCENVSPMQPEECGAIDAPLGTDARFRFPFDAHLDGRGGFFVVDSHNNLVRRVDLTTSAVTTVARVQRTVLDDFPHASTDTSETDPGTFWHPTHLAVRSPTELYVSDRSANCIRRVTLPE